MMSQYQNVSAGIITATGGIDAIGIQSGGLNVTVGLITALNFVGAGNTFLYNTTTKQLTSRLKDLVLLELELIKFSTSQIKQ